MLFVDLWQSPIVVFPHYETCLHDHNISFLVDSMSYQYLNGATIDYVEDLMEAQFQIKNPNANSTCGCGSSFSV